MLGVSDLIKDTRADQDIYAAGLKQGREEGRKEGRQAGLIEGKLKAVPILLHLRMSVQEVAERLELDIHLIGVVEGKLKAVPLLLDLGMSIQEVAERLELDINLIRQAIDF